MSDLISREDAIESFCEFGTSSERQGKTLITMVDAKYAFIKTLESLPSADAVQEAVPTVVRVTMSDGSQYYLEHEGDAIQADAIQGEWKIDEYGIYHCPFCHAINNTVYKSFCPNCGARMKGGAK